MSQTAFLTGATGFVGSHLARQLYEHGWQVHILARPTSPMEEIADLPLTRHTGDITDPESLRKAVPQGVDVVFHVAASTNLWSRGNEQQTRINVDGTRNTLEAATEAGARRFVHTSSFITWGLLDHCFNETSPRSDRSDWINYVRTKHQAENLVQAADAEGKLEAVILNPANVLGPGDWHNWSRIIRMLKKGKLPAAPPGGGNFCDVREVAAAHLRAADNGRRGEKYLLGGHFERISEVVSCAGAIMGCRAPGAVVPGWLFRSLAGLFAPVASITGKEPDITPEAAAMASHDIRCDSSKAERELGYRAVPVEDMLRDTIDWMNDKGLLV